MTTAALLNEAMLLLARQPGAIFIGQGVLYDGVASYESLEGVPTCCRIEFPVAEELNVGVAIGLSLMGFLPVVIVPRFDFLLRAADQLINHLDKLEEMSHGDFRPKVIIRTRVGSRTPLDPGPQHRNDYSLPFAMMLSNVRVRRIVRSAEILPTYQQAVEWSGSTLVVEAL